MEKIKILDKEVKVILEKGYFIWPWFITIIENWIKKWKESWNLYSKAFKVKVWTRNLCNWNYFEQLMTNDY